MTPAGKGHGGIATTTPAGRCHESRQLRFSQVVSGQPSGDAAEATAGDPSATKGQAGAPILRAGLVESNLTPARQQRARVFRAIVATPPRQGVSSQLFTVN